MKQFVYRLSLFVTIVTFITCLLSGISLATSIIRSAIVFLVTLFIIIVALNILRWGLLAASPAGEKKVNETQVNKSSE